MDTDHEFAPKVDKPLILSTTDLDKQKIESMKVESLPAPTDQPSSPPIASQKRLIPVIELPASQRAVDPPSSDSAKDDDDSKEDILELQP